MSDQDEGGKILRQQIDAYLEERKKFAIGFVRFVLERGLETKAPPRSEGKPAETWREVGQRLYGMDFFEATLAAEIKVRREAHA